MYVCAYVYITLISDSAECERVVVKRTQLLRSNIVKRQVAKSRLVVLQQRRSTCYCY
jgi:hypothetical protein